MGFFKKLFEKKVCDICGGEIGLLGNRKLEDGNLCKDCARKLSPWFSDRRSSTVAQIQEQLAYREENLKQLQSFEVTRIFGEYYKMYVEEVNGVPTRFYVSSDSNPLDDNPDIIAFKDVVTCVTNVDTNRTELKKKNAEGQMVSYTPPKYEYSYRFQIEMSIRNNPYFNDIDFQIHSSPVTMTVHEYGTGAVNRLLSNATREPVHDPDYRKYQKICQEIEQIVQEGKQAALAGAQAPAAPAPSVEEPETAPAAPVAAKPANCPACGAPAGAGKFCEFCGSPL